MESKTPPPETEGRTQSALNRFRAYYIKHEKRVDIGVFLGGFFFDIFTLGRIDDAFNIIQQSAYLAILLTLILLEVRYEILKQPQKHVVQRIWPYRNLIIHFLLGSLLSVYTLFFFKAASLLSTLTFVLLIALVMVLNELPFIQNLGVTVRVVLWNLCFGSFLAIHTPTLFGYIGWLPFMLSMTFGGAIASLIHKRIKVPPEQKVVLKKAFLYPALATYIVFALLYLFKLVPPVPLSLEYIGIYHRIEKQGDEYQLFYSRPDWKIWQNGAQTFLAQPGDKIHCFVQIFAPTSFKDKFFVKWYMKDAKSGWVLWDTIPLPISGGRETGFRGYAVKANYQPGDWMVIAETSDGREIGRISLTIEPEVPSDMRKFDIDRR